MLGYSSTPDLASPLIMTLVPTLDAYEAQVTELKQELEVSEPKISLNPRPTTSPHPDPNPDPEPDPDPNTDPIRRMHRSGLAARVMRSRCSSQNPRGAL